MEIYLDHPQHGAMVVYSMAEADKWAGSGWRLRNPQPGQPRVVEPKPERVVGVDVNGDGKIDFAFKPRGRPRKAG
jgi:hypothetical protein